MHPLRRSGSSFVFCTANSSVMILPAFASSNFCFQILQHPFGIVRPPKLDRASIMARASQRRSRIGMYTSSAETLPIIDWSGDGRNGYEFGHQPIDFGGTAISISVIFVDCQFPAVCHRPCIPAVLPSRPACSTHLRLAGSAARRNCHAVSRNLQDMQRRKTRHRFRQ